MKREFTRRAALAQGGIWLGLLGGCATTLLPAPPPAPTLFALDHGPAERRPAGRATGTRTLLVAVPRAAAGVDTRGIVYVRQVHTVEIYAQSQWVDTPAQMLQPLVVRALEQTGAFRAVLRAPSAASADLRLDIELLRLQQDFTVTPSQVRLSLRATLVDTSSRRALEWREFDARVAAPSEDAYGGVRAANLAVQGVLEELAAFAATAGGG